MFCVSYDTQMARRYDSSPTALPDLYGMYNPFAYPQMYTQTMANRMMSMVDDSVQRGLRRYFDQNEMPELALHDLGAEFRIVSNVSGYSPSDLRIENKDGFLTISGEKRQTFQSPDRQMESTSVSSFRKTIRAPKGTASASLLGGNLTISIPKR